ncbi:helix-turn-helix domain-containing protein [Pseudomonas luteola]
MTKELENSFGEVLWYARTKLGMTQDDFLPQWSEGYVSKIERGLKNPTLTTVHKLAETLGIHTTTLVALCFMYHEDMTADEVVQKIKEDLKKFEDPKK